MRGHKWWSLSMEAEGELEIEYVLGENDLPIHYSEDKLLDFVLEDIEEIVTSRGEFGLDIYIDVDDFKLVKEEEWLYYVLIEGLFHIYGETRATPGTIPDEVNNHDIIMYLEELVDDAGLNLRIDKVRNVKKYFETIS